MTQLQYGEYTKISGATFGDTVGRVKDVLAEEGFGILAEMDLGKTLEKKLGEPFRRYVVLGACLPSLAKRAIEEEPHIGLLLPCNVAIQEDGAEIVVSIIHPRCLFSLVNRPELLPIAEDVEARLERVIQKMRS